VEEAVSFAAATARLAGRLGLRLPGQRIVDDCPSTILAAPAARGNTQQPLHVVERAGALRHHAADLAVGDGVADADDHGGAVLWNENYSHYEP
jgi:hypothetical protein